MIMMIISFACISRNLTLTILSRYFFISVKSFTIITHSGAGTKLSHNNAYQAPTLTTLYKHQTKNRGEIDTTQPISQIKEIDDRPHEQRRKYPRPARRLNHVFQHLHRHTNTKLYDDNNILADKNSLSANEYLIQYGGFSLKEIDNLFQEFPPFKSLDVTRHIQPKIRFLKYTILGYKTPTSTLCELGKSIPSYYFGTRLERVVAPRHAFLMYHELYHGKELLKDNGYKMKLFLQACKSSSQFSNLCNKWKQEILMSHGNNIIDRKIFFSSEQIDMFETVFRRGLLSCVRNDVPIDKLEVAQIKDISELVPLLVQHGANIYEKDTRDISVLHWACGVGNNLSTVRCLCQYLDANIQADRDGATPLHWAVVGVNSKLFGLGGDLDITRYLIEEKGADCHASTKDGNSVIMWASWAKDSFLIVQYLIETHNVDLTRRNRNGCSVAHWAASGGNLSVCKYLYKNGVDFDVVNNAGNSPLCHAVAYGREEVVLWLKNVVGTSQEAKDLANKFANWMEGDDSRRQVLNLF